MKEVDFIEQYQDFSEQSRLWLYQADRILSELEQKEINLALAAFTQQWAAHGQALKAGSAILYNAIIVLMVDNSFENASGCSIDSSVRFIKELGAKYDFSCFDRNKFAVLEEDVLSISLIQNSSVNEDALVLNTALSSFQELKSKLFLPYKQSAYAQLNQNHGFTLSL